MDRWRTYLTVGIVSFATVIIELVQMRILSFIFWNHLVYLTISVALLGFGISGSLVAIFSSKIFEDRSKHLARYLLGFGASTAVGLLATTCLPFLGLNTSILKVLFCYVVYLIPFVFAGAILSVLLSWDKYNVARLYAVDLLCAGAACIAFFFLLPLLEPSRLLGLIALSMALLSLFWNSKREKLITYGAATVCALGMTLISVGTDKLPLFPEAYKELCGNIASKKKIETTVWTPLCRIDVVSGGDHDKNITQDGSAPSLMFSARQIEKTWSKQKNKEDDQWITIVFEVKPQPDLAIIGVGGGGDIINGIGYGAKSIIAAELNPATYQLLREGYAKFNGDLCKDPRLTLVNEEGRSMLRKQDKQFDIIQVTAIDTFAALSSGAFVLSENYLYTVEAFQEMFSRLRPDGILSFTRWNTIPPKESLRLVGLGCEAWKLEGSKTIDQQLFVFMGGEEWTVSLYKKCPFTQEEMDTLRKAAVQRKLTVLFWPKILPKEAQEQMERDYYTGVAENARQCSSTFNQLIAAYTNGEEKKFFESYPYMVSPSTDDSPFFFEYYKKNLLTPADFNALRSNAALSTLYVVLIEATVFTVLAIFWPLFKFQRQGMQVAHSRSFSLYFTAVGIGFMLVEICLVQKNVLFLGNPLYSLPVVLASLLVSAGCGSWIVSKMKWPTQTAIKIFGGLLLLCLLVLGVFVNPLYYKLMYLPLALRMLTTLLVVAPIGLLMGTFLPIGLNSVSAKAANYTPWAWGINGCASVYGSFFAIILAINFGFTYVLLFGMVVYLVAVLAAIQFSKPVSNS